MCPSKEAEPAVLEVVNRAALTGRFQLKSWTLRLVQSSTRAPLHRDLIGLDAFGDHRPEGPTYPIRSEFQFDEKLLWLFMGRDEARMKYKFECYRLPL